MALNAPYGPAGIYGGREEKMEGKMDDKRKWTPADLGDALVSWGIGGVEQVTPSPQPPDDITPSGAGPTADLSHPYHAQYQGPPDGITCETISTAGQSSSTPTASNAVSVTAADGPPFGKQYSLPAAPASSPRSNTSPTATPTAVASSVTEPGAQEALPPTETGTEKCEHGLLYTEWCPSCALNRTDVARLQAALTRSEEWSQKRAEDIMTLGCEVGRLQAALEAAERKLREAEAERDLADKALDEVEEDATRWIEQLNEALAANATLQREKDEAERQAKAWKANHDEMVARNSLLRDRPDLPMERLQSYDRFMQRFSEAIARAERAEADVNETKRLFQQAARQNHKLALDLSRAEEAVQTMAADFLQVKGKLEILRAENEHLAAKLAERPLPP